MPCRGVPEVTGPVPITPGIFKGDSRWRNSHGTELIQLSFSQEDFTSSSYMMFTGTKITGDPTVPAGQRSFKGSLNDGLIMPLDEQVRIYPITLKVNIPVYA